MSTRSLKTNKIHKPENLYADTSVLVAAFFNEPLQVVAMALHRAPEWAQVFVNDWTLIEFACVVHAK